MTALPVLLRECRVEARRPANYWLRVLGAGFMAFVFMALVSSADYSGAQLGAALFPKFHTILFIGVMLVAPLLTADCLAAEKREGTFPLLLMTQLSAGGIVTAKMLVHSLRALTLVFAAFPLLRLPFLLGGVGAAEVSISVLLCLTILVLGLAGGVLASATTESATRATLLALACGLILCLWFAQAYAWCFERWLAPLTGTIGARFTVEFGVWQVLTDYNRYWPRALAQFPRAGQEAWVAMTWCFFGASALIAVLVVQLAARLARWTAVGRGVFRWEKVVGEWWRIPRLWGEAKKGKWRRHLRANPLYWLQKRTWSARAARWGWAAFVVVMELPLWWLAPAHDIWLIGQLLVGLTLMLGVIYASASSYRLEKQNGILELILITPLKPWRLASARVRWLWVQFLPGYLLWVGLSHITRPTLLYVEDLLQLNCFAFAVGLVAPVIGLDCAANCRGHWRAILTTAGWVLLGPSLVFFCGLHDGWRITLLACLVVWIVGLVTTVALELQLRERKFRYLHPHVARRHRSRRKRPARLRAPAVLMPVATRPR